MRSPRRVGTRRATTWSSGSRTDRRLQRRQPQHRRVLRRLIELSESLTAEEQRTVSEGLTEEELAIFDLLAKPEPVLTDDEREVVKASAKRLLAHLHDKLVLDWRRKAATTAEVRTTILDVPTSPHGSPTSSASLAERCGPFRSSSTTMRTSPSSSSPPPVGT